MPPQPDSSSPLPGPPLHLIPASHLDPPAHCLVSPPPVPSPHLALDLSSTLLHPLVIPGRPPRPPSPHPAFLLNSSPPWNLTPPVTTNWPDPTQPRWLPPHPFLSPAPLQAPVSYADTPPPPVSPSGLPPLPYPTPVALSPLFGSPSSFRPLCLLGILRSSESPPHLHQLQVPSPPVRPSRAHYGVESSPLAAGRTHARAAPAPRAPALPLRLVAAAPAPAPQAAAVASPPPPAARRSLWAVSVRGDRPELGGWDGRLRPGAARGSPTS